jgi:hypothetical protein
MKKLKSHHESAAEYFEKAAEHHRAAAEHAEDGEHEAATQQAHIAYGYALLGHEQAASATKQYVELETETDKE